MHEMSIAIQLLGQVERAAAEHQVERVEQVEVTIGVMRQVVAEALGMAFEIAAEGTAAAGAALKIVEEPVEAACRGCGRRFGTDAEEFLCPGCGQADVEIISGNDIVLTSMVCEKAEGTAQA